MATKIPAVLNMIERLKDEEDVVGLVERYRDVLLTAEGVQALVERLNERRERLSAWRGVKNLCENLRRRREGEVKHRLEHATQAVIATERIDDLADVADRYPIVFTGSFISTLSRLANEAMGAGEEMAARLVMSRLRVLQLLSLAKKQGLDIRDRDKISAIVYQILEARSFRDLLERINENPVVLVESFQAILKGVLKEPSAQHTRGLSSIIKFRNDVIDGIRAILEAVVLKREAPGGTDAAAEALSQSLEADKFVLTVAKFPFVLGEDFFDLIEREIHKAKVDGDMKAVEGLDRRRGHLKILAEIVEQLMDPFVSEDDIEQQLDAPPEQAAAEAGPEPTAPEAEPEQAVAEAGPDEEDTP